MTELPKVSDLTDEQLNQMVAEECGWTNIEGGFGCPPERYRSPLLRYTHSLDAMAQAERTLAGENQWAYIEVLQDILSTIFTYDIATARAKQRAMAFVVAKGRAVL